MILSLIVIYLICLAYPLYPKIGCEFKKICMKLILSYTTKLVSTYPKIAWRSSYAGGCVLSYFMTKDDIRKVLFSYKDECPIEMVWGDISSPIMKFLPMQFWSELADLAWGTNWSGNSLNTNGMSQINRIKKFIKTYPAQFDKYYKPLQN